MQPKTACRRLEDRIVAAIETRATGLCANGEKISGEQSAANVNSRSR
jgi:hypothetical protein